MTLVTTPGAANADSYAALADADSYFTDRGIATWTGTNAVKESALRRATAYLDNQYRGKWIGVRTGTTQSLAWPRSDGSRDIYAPTFLYPLVDVDGVPIATDAVPVQIQRAAMEAALLVVIGVSIEPNLERGGAIKSIGKRVGPLGKDITYQDGAPAVDRYVAIEGLLAGLVTSTPGAGVSNVRLVRS